MEVAMKPNTRSAVRVKEALTIEEVLPEHVIRQSHVSALLLGGT
jgi:hypothetical protein